MNLTEEEKKKIADEVKKAIPDIKDNEIFIEDEILGTQLSLRVRWNLDKLHLEPTESD